MAQYYAAKEISEKLKEQLTLVKWESKNNGEAFQITLPVVCYFNYQRLTLTIFPVDDGYYIFDDGLTFCEYSCDPKYYFDLFNEQDKNYHYDIELKDNYICKKFKYDYSLMSAIDEFIRFFIFLDIYMSKNF